MKKILAALLVALLIVQAGMFTAFAGDQAEGITVYVGIEETRPVIYVEFSQDLLEKIMTGEGTWDDGRLVISGDDIQLQDGKYSFELRLSAEEGFVFDNDLSIRYQGIDGVYTLHYDFPLDQEGRYDYHTMIVTGEFENIISASPLINMGNIKSDDIARMIALVISGDYEGALNFLLDDGVPFSEKAHIDKQDSSCVSVSDDTYSYQLVLKTNEGFTFTNALDFTYNEEVYGYKLEYKYDLDNNGHTLVITGTGSESALNSLIKAIEEARTISNSDGKYTPESFKVLQDAIAKAEKVAANENSTKMEIVTANIAIALAKAGLVESSSGTDPDGPTPEDPDNPTPVDPQPAPAPVVTPTTPIEIQDLPAIKLSKPAVAKKSVNIKWKKISKKNLKKVQGIEIQAATDPEFTNIVKTATLSKKKTSKKIKGLESRKTYYIRIRTYKNADDGRHVSAWRAKKVKIR